MGRPRFCTHKMWIAVKTDNWNGTAFVEKDGEICVDFCRETGIMIPAFERTLDFEDRAEKVQKNLKKFLTNSRRCDIMNKLFYEQRGNASAPCKLNNEKHEQTPWTI